MNFTWLKTTVLTLGLTLCAIPWGMGMVHAGSKTQTVQTNGSVLVGQKLPAFGGWSTTGKRMALATLLKNLKGTSNHLIISVFSSTCKPCRKGLPLLQQFANTPEGKNNQFVLVAYGETNAQVKDMLKDLKVTLPVLEDKYTKISGRIGVDGVLPRTYVVDAKGVVKAIIAEEGDDFVDVLKKLSRKP